MIMGSAIYVGVAHSAGASDITAPSLVSAIINSAGTSLTLTYDELLDSASTPLAGAYSLTGTAQTVSSVNVTGSTVVLSLSGVIGAGASITVSYTAGASPVQDVAGNDAANLSSHSVTNNSTQDLTAPTLSSAVIDVTGLTLTLTYNEALDTGSTPSSGAFSLSGTSSTVSSVNITGSTVALTLSSAVTPGATVTISYTAGGSPIQDVAGNDAANLSNQSTTNNAGVNPVTSGLILELDSSDSYLTYDGSNRISDWADKSGVGNNGTSTAKPLRVTGQLDGKNAVRFDATNVRIGRTALVGGARGAQSTVVLVIKKTNNTSAQILCGQSASSTTYIVRTDSTQWGIQQGTTQSEAVGTADTSWHIVLATYDTTDTLYVDDMTTAKVSANAGSTTADGWFLGRSTSGGVFDCAAHLIYNRALSSGERASIKTYLRTVYPSLPA